MGRKLHKWYLGMVVLLISLWMMPLGFVCAETVNYELTIAQEQVTIEGTSADGHDHQWGYPRPDVAL